MCIKRRKTVVETWDVVTACIAYDKREWWLIKKLIVSSYIARKQNDKIENWKVVLKKETFFIMWRLIGEIPSFFQQNN
jgi:hypothetical protein